MEILKDGSRPWYGMDPGGYFQKNWVAVCGTLPETVTLFQGKICDFPYPISDLIKNVIPYFRPGAGGDSHMKQTGMLIVSLRGVNFGCWSRLGCSGQSANILRCRLGFREETQNYAKRNRSQIFFLTCFVYRITSVIINQRFLQIVENIII